MAELVDVLPLADLGWMGVVMVIIGLILTGRLVPRRVVDDIRADRDARIREAMVWRQAWAERGETLRQVVAQNARLLELSETSAHALSSLPAPDEQTAPTPDEGGEGR